MRSFRFLLLVVLMLGALAAPAAAQTAAEGMAADGAAADGAADNVETTEARGVGEASAVQAEQEDGPVPADETVVTDEATSEMVATAAVPQNEPVVVVDDTIGDPGEDCASTDTCGDGHHGSPVEEETEATSPAPGPPPVSDDVTAVGGIVIERPEGAATIQRPARTARGAHRTARRAASTARVGAAADTVAARASTALPQTNAALADTGLPAAAVPAALAALALGLLLLRAGSGTPAPPPRTWSLPAAQ